MLVGVAKKSLLKEIFTKQEVIIESHKLSQETEERKWGGGGRLEE